MLLLLTQFHFMQKTFPSLSQAQFLKTYFQTIIVSYTQNKVILNPIILILQVIKILPFYHTYSTTKSIISTKHITIKCQISYIISTSHPNLNCPIPEIKIMPKGHERSEIQFRYLHRIWPSCDTINLYTVKRRLATAPSFVGYVMK